MPIVGTIVVAASLLACTTMVNAQYLRDKLLQGADMMKEGASIAGYAVVEGAGQVATQLEESVNSSVDLLTNEATPEETRAELDAMAKATFQRLLAEQPETASLIDRSVGAAVFDTRKLVIAGIAAGAGRGVAVARDERRPIYMVMGSGGLGLSLGVGGFETKVVILFESDADFDEFVTAGYDATADAGTMFGDEKTNLSMAFVEGRAIFYITDQGWKASATAAGTKYWIDPTLN